MSSVNTDLYVKVAVEGELRVPCSLPVALLEHQIERLSPTSLKFSLQITCITSVLSF